MEHGESHQNFNSSAFVPYHQEFQTLFLLECFLTQIHFLPIKSLSHSMFYWWAHFISQPIGRRFGRLTCWRDHFWLRGAGALDNPGHLPGWVNNTVPGSQSPPPFSCGFVAGGNTPNTKGKGNELQFKEVTAWLKPNFSIHFSLISESALEEGSMQGMSVPHKCWKTWITEYFELAFPCLDNKNHS